MRLFALFALFTVSFAADLSAVDNAREKFYSVEDTLWNNVLDPTWQGRTALGGDIELTKAFVAFNEVIESIQRPPRPPLASWLWAKMSEKLNIIDGFYKNFVDFVKRQAVPGAVPAPVREWLDVAEQVLMDPKSSVAQAVRKLHDLLDHGDMFRAALQVINIGSCSLRDADAIRMPNVVFRDRCMIFGTKDCDPLAHGVSDPVFILHIIVLWQHCSFRKCFGLVSTFISVTGTN